MKKQRVAGTTYPVTTAASGPPITLGQIAGIPAGHRVYLVNVLNPTGNGTEFVGSDLTSDYQLLAGASKDFYFVDPSKIQFRQTAAQTVYVDVSGEFPGTCPKCDGADD